MRNMNEKKIKITLRIIKYALLSIFIALSPPVLYVFSVELRYPASGSIWI